VLISKSPPAVNADAHDHGERRPSNNDATLVHTPIASKAQTTGNPRLAASQYGRMRLVLERRIFRGLDNRGVEGRKARAAYDLWRTSHA
jgi:hypothetical protein